MIRGATLLITSNKVINMKDDKVIINKMISDRNVLSGKKYVIKVTNVIINYS